jgi:hypothetical protein
MRRLIVLSAVILAVSIIAVGCGTDEAATTTGDPTATGADVSSAMGPGISVAEALESTVSGPILVNGFIVTGSDGTIFLSAVLAESFPPQPGGEALVVQGLDIGTVHGLETEQGISWTDQAVQLLGDVRNGVLTVSTTSSG